jgi:transposase
MVNRKIEAGIHAAALRGTLDPRIPQDSFRAVSSTMMLSCLLGALIIRSGVQALGGIHPRTIERTKKRLECTETIAFDTSNKGRPRSLARYVVDHIISLIETDPAIDQETIQKYLEQSGYQITVSTISRTIKREGFTHKRLKKIAMERSASSRPDFAIRMADYGVEQLVWVDESSKDERTCMRSYGYGRRGQDAVIEAPFIRGRR